MENLKIFISVGGTSTIKQEDFVKSVENRLVSENLIPNTVGRNKFSAGAPLKAVKDLMDECSGLIVIALERTYFEVGMERRGSNRETVLNNIKYTTPWNQIEAGMGYVKGMPILVIIEDGIRIEGLLEKGYDWYVLTVVPNSDSLITNEFNGVLADWKEKVLNYNQKKKSISTTIIPEELTIGQILNSMKASTLWAILAAIAGLMAFSFFIGQYFPQK